MQIMVTIVLLALCQFASSLDLLLYKLWKNYGNEFCDYSMSKKQGVNGNSKDPDSQDTIPTDRGAYYKDTFNSLIQVPTTDSLGQKIEFSGTFISYMWVNLQQIPSNGAVLIERTSDSAPGVVLIIYSDGSLEIKASDAFSTVRNRDRELSSNNKSSFKTNFRMLAHSLNLNTWTGIGLRILENADSKKANGMINAAVFGTFTIVHDESTASFYTNIGGRPSVAYSINGFVWKFKVTNVDGFTNTFDDANVCDTNQDKTCLPTDIQLGYNISGNSCASGCQGWKEEICLVCDCQVSGCEYDYDQHLSLCICPDGNTTSSNICQTSIECNVDYCSNCSSNNMCSVCNDPYTLNNGACICNIDNCKICEAEVCTECNDGYYVNNNSCELCGENCIICDSVTCLNCEENSSKSLINPQNCDCKKGFRNENGCKRNYFTASSTISSNNEVSILFNESLSLALKEEDFIYHISVDKNPKVKFLSLSKAKYQFKITSDDGIDNGSVFNVSLNSSYLISVDGSLYIESDLAINLVSTSTEAQSIVLLNNAAGTTAMAAAISSSASGVLSNPALFWTMFNTLTLLSYSPLNSVPITQSLASFFNALNIISIFPSPSSLIGIPQKNSEPYSEARNFGLETSLFIVNVDVIITHLLINLLLILIFYLGSLLPFVKLKNLCLLILNKYRYGYFLRLLTAGFLDFSLFAFVQLRTVPYTAIGIASTTIACIVLAITVSAPFVILYKSYKVLDRIKNFNDKEFHSKWGGLFQEFKNDRGFLSTQYYFIFMMRRMIFAFSQVFLDGIPTLQLSLNITGTFFVVWFIFKFRPFDEKSVMISQLVGELTIFVAFMLEIVFFMNANNSTKETVQITIMSVVFCCVLIQTLISFLDLVFKIFCRKSSHAVLTIPHVTHVSEINKCYAFETGIK